MTGPSAPPPQDRARREEHRDPSPAAAAATFSDYARFLRRRAWVILVALALGLAGGWWYGNTQPEIYEAFADVNVQAHPLPGINRPLYGPDPAFLETQCGKMSQLWSISGARQAPTFILLARARWVWIPWQS